MPAIPPTIPSLTLPAVLPATPTETVLTAELPKRSLSSVVTAVSFIAMHLAALAVFFIPGALSLPAIALIVAVYVARGFGLTAGYHRYFAHRAYKTSRYFQFVLGCLGAAALQRGPMWWAGHHRVHHKHSDDHDDPHSPIAKTIWWSHVGWVLSNRYNATEWALMKDFQKYPELKYLERFDLVPGVLVGLACAAFGAATGVAGGFWGALAGFFFGTVILYHATFMVNSLCHLMGSRRFSTKDHSRNNAFVAFFTLGEGWHNNHHHYPSSARQGFRWYEYDFSYVILKCLSAVGIVWDLREPTPRALASKRAVK